jgi:hypothetical protein
MSFLFLNKMSRFFAFSITFMLPLAHTGITGGHNNLEYDHNMHLADSISQQCACSVLNSQ